MTSSESFFREYYNMEDKILGFQFEPLSVKPYSNGSNQDEAET